MDQVRLRDYCDQVDALVQAGDFAKAIYLARHILEHYPRYIRGRDLLGQALLGEEQYQEAARQFLWVLSVDPEHVASRVGLARVSEALGQGDKSVMHMQHAYDLSPSDSNLRHQLNHLRQSVYGRVVKGSSVTRAGLGKIYANSGLYSKAIQEFRAVLDQEPERIDVQMALAVVLWRDGRRSASVKLGQEILERYPNVLKANLIVGAAFLEGPFPYEAQPYLGLAQALDPENVTAQSVLGGESPLLPVPVMIAQLSEEEIKRGLHENVSLAGESPAVQSIEPVMQQANEDRDDEEEGVLMSSGEERRTDDEFEIPDWLKGVGDDLLEDSSERHAAPDLSSAPAVPAGEETPDWLRDLVTSAESTLLEDETSTLQDETDVQVRDTAADGPDWLTGVKADSGAEKPGEESELPADVTSEKMATPSENGSSIEEIEEKTLLEEANLSQEVPEEEWTPWLRTEPEAVSEDSVAARNNHIPVWLADETEPTDLVMPDVDDLEGELALAQEDEDNVPAWLRELRETRLDTLEDWPQQSPKTAGIPDEDLESVVPPDSVPQDDQADVPVEPVHHFEGELDETMEESPLESDLVEEEVVWPEKPYEEVPDVSGPEESLPVQSESTAETENTPFPPGTEVSSLTESIDGSPEIDTSIEEGEDALEQAYQSLEGPGELMDEEIEVFFPEKPEERLELARVAVQEGRLKQALEIYSSLINSSELLDSVINDLEESTARYPDDFTGFQVLGDAYVKSGRLPSALRAYRTALSKT